MKYNETKFLIYRSENIFLQQQSTLIACHPQLQTMFLKALNLWDIKTLDYAF